MFSHIKNHSAVQCHRGVNPWDWTPEGEMPSFEDKDEFRKWCQLPTTNHFFYSLYEGLNPGQRVNHDNPPHLMHGVIADYDSLVLPADWPAIASRCAPDFQPAWGSKTFSGNARLVWLFEAPVFVYEEKVHQAFLTRLERELRVNKCLPGFEREAWLDNYKTYEVGSEWQKLSESRVSTTSLHYWLFKAGEKASWSSSGLADIPIERVQKKMQELFPGHRWQGDFDIGMRGVRFWDPDANNHTAAVVRDSGMQCFTGDRPFMSWREIFNIAKPGAGDRFVAQFEEDRVVGAVKDVWFDGTHYWRLIGGIWQMHSKEDISLHFKCAGGLNGSRSAREASTEVERALYHVQCYQRVERAVPFVLQKPGIVLRHGRKHLNISPVRALTPASEPQEWGVNFPFIATWLNPDAFFSTGRDQWDNHMTWLQRLYATALEQHLAKGQSVFIAGPVNQGKTLLVSILISDLVGGSMEAASVLLGESQFNGSHYSVPLWTVNDSSANSDPRTRQKFSSNVKKLAANSSFEFLAKFRDAKVVEWSGRVVVTLNTDTESLQMLPEADISILDKVQFYRIADRKFEFPPDAHEVIRQELPFFARWLLDWTPPPECLGDTRYGVTPYHEESLLGEARQLGRTAEFRELLNKFREDYFKHSPDLCWEGSASDLVLIFNANPELKELFGLMRLTTNGVGRELRKLEALGYSLRLRTLKGRPTWRVDREDTFPEMTSSLQDPSMFDKGTQAPEMTGAVNGVAHDLS